MRSQFESLIFQAMPETGRSSLMANRFEDTFAGEHHIVEVASKYMRDNFSNNISVEQVAKRAFVSQYHFSRIFKRHTQYSPYQYLLNLRLEHARILIERTEFSVKEITFRAGFNSLDYFSAAFTKKYKVCPSLYRKTLS